MKRLPYTPEEENIIRKYHKTKTIGEIAAMLNRSQTGVSKRMKRMGIQEVLFKGNARPFTKADDDVIKQYWNSKSVSELSQMIKRNQGSISKRAKRLGLEKKKIIRPFTNEEDKIIDCMWKDNTITEIARVLNRPVNSVWKRSKILCLDAKRTPPVYMIFKNDKLLCKGSSHECEKATGISRTMIYNKASTCAVTKDGISVYKEEELA